ncbi:aminopeptidase N [Neisseria sp. Ec49-e6-T10]|uniref:aminopeptidase N n=1 Tax=Neisseria sp. Ec49-e6-T10 TaxID=3140744 RepID=UPI003EBDE0F9
MTKQLHTQYLKDYQAPEFTIDQVDLHFDIEKEYVNLRSRLLMHPIGHTRTLQLMGSALLKAVLLDGQELKPEHYKLDVDNEVLTVFSVPESIFVLEIVTQLEPKNNKSLMGLYQSNGNLFTQCEPEGFRKMTYYLDRPDVMAKFSTTIVADKHDYPVLLSNGNLVAQGIQDKNRHWVKWVDPFRKPSYLFALVAGNLALSADEFITRSGKKVALHFYTEKQDQHKVDFAIESLKNAMKWDEERFGLEYDLDIYMVVAVGDFNMGAMENKGLNIFNTKYVLASTQTATDADFEGIESVIGHEYFHNYTGNRVTCRDWFQLSLKEGLTVFRDQEFSADRASRAVRRIENVRLLRAMQFAEDAGPMAHPVRPASFVEINNFYTLTIYEKGAEVVRMMHTILGEVGFQKGMQLYFERFDGKAVTCDDFRNAMADANQINLDQFALWYSQAGTPIINASGKLDSDNHTYTLTLSQQIPSTPDGLDKKPMMIPVLVGLLNEQGQEVLTKIDETEAFTQLLLLTEEIQSFVFENITESVVPSLLREFSAPVRLFYPYSEQELAILMAHDVNSFTRWEAAQTLFKRAIQANYEALSTQAILPEHCMLIESYKQALVDDGIDSAFKALLLTLPSVSELLEEYESVQPRLLVQAHEVLLDKLAVSCVHEFSRIEKACLIKESTSDYKQPYDYHPDLAGVRSLLNVVRAYLVRALPDSVAMLAKNLPKQSPNMTHYMGALQAVNNSAHPQRMLALNEFAEHFKEDALVLDKYFMLIGSSKNPEALKEVQEALQHPAFSIENPNKVRSLLGSFSRNIEHFHHESGSGYALLVDKIIQLDQFNPQIAARLLQAFNILNKLDSKLQVIMRGQLARLVDQPELSKDTAEVLGKILG